MQVVHFKSYLALIRFWIHFTLMFQHGSADLLPLTAMNLQLHTKTHTCSIDYILLGVWISKNISEGVKSFLSDSNQILNLYNKALIKEIIERIEVNQWYEAKSQK